MTINIIKHKIQKALPFFLRKRGGDDARILVSSHHLVRPPIWKGAEYDRLIQILSLILALIWIMLALLGIMILRVRLQSILVHQHAYRILIGYLLELLMNFLCVNINEQILKLLDIVHPALTRNVSLNRHPSILFFKVDVFEEWCA